MERVLAYPHTVWLSCVCVCAQYGAFFFFGACKTINGNESPSSLDRVYFASRLTAPSDNLTVKLSRPRPRGFLLYLFLFIISFLLVLLVQKKQPPQQQQQQQLLLFIASCSKLALVTGCHAPLAANTCSSFYQIHF